MIFGEKKLTLSVDPAFWLMRFHSMTWLAFYLFCENLIFVEKNLESPLIFVLFLKGKQNKKENRKCDSLFGKGGLWKTKSRFGSQVTYWEGTVKTVAPL